MRGNLVDAETPVNLAGQGVENQDWTKMTWDLRDPTTGELVEDLPTLQRVLREAGTTVEEFVRLPAYQFAVDSGDHEWLEEIRPR